MTAVITTYLDTTDVTEIEDVCSVSELKDDNGKSSVKIITRQLECYVFDMDNRSICIHAEGGN